MTRATLTIALMCVDERARSLRAAAAELRRDPHASWADSGYVKWAERCEAEAWRCAVAREDIAACLADASPLGRTA